ncbi:hypothetical protein Q5L94_12215 [Idiomarina sp. Sol25]|uniref:hypothetical protein n=1 Tax=Idiomarina sp. Sol25 TaxID=3064000 RepID=UPI00294B705C|nr:hypothetical protein [Idiomarina sp. Sol25]MDV6328825.1 hypothetical protein [Idiomarina sp. Sol25]
MCEIDNVILALADFILSEKSESNLTVDEKQVVFHVKKLNSKTKLPRTKKEKLDLCNELIRKSKLLSSRGQSSDHTILEQEELTFINKVIKG